MTVKLTLPVGRYSRFSANLSEPTDLTVELEVLNDVTVLLAIYARQGAPPTHVLHDAVQYLVQR